MQTVFVFLSLCAVCILADSTPQDFPNPKIDPARCGRPGVVASNICDPDGLLTKEQKDVLEGLVDMVTKAELSLVIIQSMARKVISDAGTVEKATEKFASHLHDSWGVGSAQRQDGLLVFLSVNDRSVYLSKGRGLDGRITSLAIQEIIADIKPDLRAALYHTALERVVIHVDLLLDGALSKGDLGQAYLKPRATDADAESPWFRIIAFFFFSCAGLLVLFNTPESEDARLRRGQRAMERLVQDVEEASQNRFSATSCPICLEDFAAVPAAPSPDADIKSTDIDQKDSGEKGRKPLALRCGHVFCRPCLSEFLKGQDQRCPICRQPVDGGGAAPARNSPPAAAATSAAQLDFNPGSSSAVGTDSVDDASCSGSTTRTHDTHAFYRGPRGYDYGPEMLFRMQRLHMLHPRVMDEGTLSSMTQAVNQNDIAQVRNLAQARSHAVTTMIQQIQEQRAKAAERGSSGSSRSSFGGGRSGGGGGGRW